MAFDWHEFLVFAEELENTSKDEAALRSAVSRAYYAAFNQAERFLRQREIEIRNTENSHEAVWNAFERHKDRTWKAVYNSGDALKRKRVLADYREGDQNWSEEVKHSIKYAKNIEYYLKQLIKKGT